MTVRQKRAGFAVLLIAGAIPRIYLATVGHNYDLESFVIVVRAMLDGESVYAATNRYNYGPGWGSILFLLVHLQSGFPAFDTAFGPEAFHVVIAAFLSLVDGALAVLLAARFGYVAGLALWLSPVSVLITGFHSQFDNVAVLVALGAWLLIEPPANRAKPRLWAWSAALLGLSLVIKHIFVLFPLWMLFWRGLGGMRRRIAYGFIVYAVFFGSFLPWLADPASRAGIVGNVFLYPSPPAGLLPLVALLGLGGHVFPPLWIFKVLWVGFIGMIGWVSVKHREADAPFLYLLAFVGLAPSLADQYLAIPLAACARFARYGGSWAYTLMAVATLIVSPSNVNRDFATTVASELPPVLGIAPVYPLLASLAQAPLLVLLFTVLFVSNGSRLRSKP